MISRRSEEDGCGGAAGLSYECIIKMGGLDPAFAYPNTGSATKCKVNKAFEIKHVISNYTMVPSNEGGLLAAVAKNPVAILIDAQVWQMYAGGVLSGSCGSQLDHAALVVGYTQDYWIAKSSWGTTWGDGSYIYLKRGDCASTGAGECGLLVAASYATV